MTDVRTPISNSPVDQTDIDCCERGRTRQRNQDHGRSSRAKRRLGQEQDMSEDTDAREAQRQRVTLESFRPVLPPPPTPSTNRSRSRSRSPVRTVLHQLRSACHPRVMIEATAVRKVDHEDAYKLSRELSITAKTPGIPEELRVRFADLIDLDLVSEDMFTHESREDHRGLTWQRAQRICRSAHSCQTETKDENAWSDVVRLILRSALLGCGNEDDEVQLVDWDIANLQTQSIQEQFLPRSNSRSYSRKTDFALAFYPLHTELTLIRQQAADLDLPLSHMNDAFTRTVPVTHSIEVKPASGNAEEAQLQLAVFFCASLTFLSSLQPGPIGVPLLLGWTVIGHTWTLYVAWLDTEGNVQMRSPSLVRPLGTTSVLDVFSLVAVLQKAIQILRERYWPAYTQALKAHLDKFGSGREHESSTYVT